MLAGIINLPIRPEGFETPAYSIVDNIDTHD